MENMDKGVTVQKWVLIVWPKIPQIPQLICPSPKLLDFIGKRLHWASVVRALHDLHPTLLKFGYQSGDDRLNLSAKNVANMTLI